MKVAIVTGAGTGIGAATALRWADKGYRLVLAGRRQTLLDDIAATIGKARGAKPWSYRRT